MCLYILVARLTHANWNEGLRRCTGKPSNKAICLYMYMPVCMGHRWYSYLTWGWLAITQLLWCCPSGWQPVRAIAGGVGGTAHWGGEERQCAWRQWKVSFSWTHNNSQQRWWPESLLLGSAYNRVVFCLQMAIGTNSMCCVSIVCIHLCINCEFHSTVQQDIFEW